MADDGAKQPRGPQSSRASDVELAPELTLYVSLTSSYTYLTLKGTERSFSNAANSPLPQKLEFQFGWAQSRLAVGVLVT